MSFISYNSLNSGWCRLYIENALAGQEMYDDGELTGKYLMNLEAGDKTETRARHTMERGIKAQQLTLVLGF